MSNISPVRTPTLYTGNSQPIYSFYLNIPIKILSIIRSNFI